jgi:prevent-host-death family protein
MNSTRRVSVVELRQSLSDCLNRAEYRGERIVIHRRDKDAAAIISIEDFRLLERLIEAEEDRIDVEAARAAEAESDERIPLGEFRAKMGIKHEPGRSSVRGEPDPGRRARPRPSAQKGH